MDLDVCIKEMQSGNMQAFDELFNAYKSAALRTAYLITGNLHTSEDVVQESFIQCYLKINTLRNAESFKPWFYRILTRTAYSLTKKDKRITPVENIYEEGNSTDDYLKNEEYNLIYSEIEKLDIKHKTAVILFYFNDLSIKDTAKALRCREGTVKSRLNTARRILKKGLSRFYAKKEVRESETLKVQ